MEGEGREYGRGKGVVGGGRVGEKEAREGEGGRKE